MLSLGMSTFLAINIFIFQYNILLLVCIIVTGWDMAYVMTLVSKQHPYPCALVYTNKAESLQDFENNLTNL
jgi:hypothetical protein